MEGSFFPSSINNDSVDKLNYKWMVILMFVLSIASYIIPLEPTYQEESFLSGYMKPVDLPIVKVGCIGKEGPTTNDLNLRYASIFCGNAFNEVIRGELDANKTRAYINFIAPIKLEKHVKYIQNRVQGYRDQEMILLSYARLRVSIQRLATFQTPATLLSIAICLTIPQFLWTFLSEFFVQGDIGKVLTSINREFVQTGEAEKRGIDTRSKVASLLYLFKKFLEIVVVLVLIICIMLFTRSGAVSLQNDVEEREPGLQTMNNKTRVRIEYPNEWIDLTNLFRSPNDTFKCDFFVLPSLADSGVREVQCSVIEVERLRRTRQSISESLMNQRNLMQFEISLLNNVIGLLSILFTINLISFGRWIGLLTCCSSQREGAKKSKIAMDMLLLYQMASINTGPGTLDIIAQLVNDDFSQYGFSNVDPKLSGEDPTPDPSIPLSLDPPEAEPKPPVSADIPIK